MTMKPRPPSTASKRGSKTPAQLSIAATRLFEPSLADGFTIDGCNASVSSNGTVVYDQMYLDQCHTWFRRETRALKTPKPQQSAIDSLVTGTGSLTEKQLQKKSLPSKSMRKRKRLSRMADVTTDENDAQSANSSVTSVCQHSPPVSGCIACSAQKNEGMNSGNFFKSLANNVLICPIHRFITHWFLDQKSPVAGLTDGTTDLPVVWKQENENLQAERVFPFSVAEDRRLVSGVRRFGTDAWHTILSELNFAPVRKPDDLMQRWNQIKSQ